MNRIVLPAFVLMVFLQGCGELEHNEIKQWMDQEAKGMRGKVPPLPEVRPYVPVAYDAASLVDPFQPSKVEPDRKLGGANAPDMNRPKEPLEDYPLESLGFVGVVIQKKQTFAIIKADEKLYKVRKGNYLGQNFGVVTQITDTELSLKEMVEDSGGDWIERTSTLQLLK